MSFLLYAAIVVGSVSQSAAAKYFGRSGGSTVAFNLLKSLAALLLFALLCAGGFSFHEETALYGAAYGVALCLSMYGGYRALCLGPMALTGLLVSFSVVIPVLYGLLFCGEEMTLFKWFGFPLFAAALLLSGLSPQGDASKEERGHRSWLFFVGVTFVSNGACSVLQKAHQLRYPGAYCAEFMLFAMAVCYLLCGVVALCRKHDFLTGGRRGASSALLSGIFNAVAGYCTIRLSAAEDAAFLFPAVSVGTICLSLLCGRVLFGERVRPPQLLSCLLGLAAILLLKI